MTFKSCIKSLRLRTLPLSLSGVVTGIALASTCTELRWGVVITLALTAVCLQILSNLSNELGDTLQGTDRADRQGIRYAMQDGEITVPQMKRMIAIAAAACCCCGLLMVWLSFRTLLAPLPILFLLLGACAIWAAMHYTLGRNPYGYRGLGDVFVFIFFGLVSVLGSAYICCHTLRPLWLLPASGIGCFCMGVLNVNNIRDMKSDAATRTTVAIKLGPRVARIYQTILLVAGWCLFGIFTLLTGIGVLSWLYWLALPAYVLHLRGVWRKTDRQLDPMLPLLVMGTFVLSLLFAIGM